MSQNLQWDIETQVSDFVLFYFYVNVCFWSFDNVGCEITLVMTSHVIFFAVSKIETKN